MISKTPPREASLQTDMGLYSYRGIEPMYAPLTSFLLCLSTAEVPLHRYGHSNSQVPDFPLLRNKLFLEVLNV